MRKILCFLIMPIIFILTRIHLVRDKNQLISFGLFIVINFILSLLLYFILNKIEFTLYKSILIAIFLSIIDQLLKIAVYKFDFNAKLVGNILRIESTKNFNQTAMFNYLNIELNSTFIIIFKIVIILFLCCIFIKIKNKSIYLWHTFVLLLSAGLSNFLDSVAWGYTLDYIYFSQLTCYDLKDFYVDTAIGFIIIEIFYNKNKQEVKK